MTAGEFSSLALGVIFGLVGGAAIMEFFRARPPAPREVRLTVAHDAIPRRASTLADDAFISAGPEPARGGPADRRLIGAPRAAGASDRRTNVRFGTVVIGSGTTMAGATMAGATMAGATMAGAIPIVPEAGPRIPGRMMEAAYETSGTDPMFSAIRVGAVRATDLNPDIVATSTAVALLDPPAVRDAGAQPGATERCAEERRVAEERCELATRARARAAAADDALQLAQRAYDEHEAAAVTASWRADPRAVHDAKESAQGGFRSAVTAAETPEALEVAARDWLSEINRINTEAGEATEAAARQHAAATAIGASLERLGLEADAARIGAENADAACLSARIVVADCDERTSSDPSTFLIPPPSTAPTGISRFDEDETLGLALEAGGTPRIFRMLRGDRAALTSLVTALAGDDKDGRRRWQLLMTGLVEAIIADAIEASALEFPDKHPFWSPFTQIQGRDIAHALASLGYRFDGLGGWTDERYPSQRDLSLALGYAGLDPMRLRKWPTAEETVELFRQVTVAADEYLAGIAGDLTLAEMVAMLGRRADGLAEVWNTWGRIRPLLLEEG